MKKSECYSLNVCSKCEHKLSDRELMHSSGACPYCGHSCIGTVCDHRKVIIRTVKHHNWWQIFGRKTTYEGKNEYSKRYLIEHAQDAVKAPLNHNKQTHGCIYGKTPKEKHEYFQSLFNFIEADLIFYNEQLKDLNEDELDQFNMWIFDNHYVTREQNDSPIKLVVVPGETSIPSALSLVNAERANSAVEDVRLEYKAPLLKDNVEISPHVKEPTKGRNYYLPHQKRFKK